MKTKLGLAASLVTVSLFLFFTQMEEQAVVQIEEPIREQVEERLERRLERESTPLKIPDPHFFVQRAYPYGKIDIAALNNARGRFHEFNQFSLLTSGPLWQQRGPNNVQGRITSIAVDPRDANVAFVGAAEGGVFRTEDMGASWTAFLTQCRHSPSVLSRWTT